MLAVDIAKKLADFTLTIQFSVDNDILVLFGHSGCGKTTTLRCIAGLADPDSGTISHDGRVLFSSAPRRSVPPSRRNVGYMFQDYALFPHLNVKHNIWYGVKQKGARATELYEKLLATLKIEHLPSRAISQLSGGEKQRVALARALMAEPAILLLDEPLSSLDSQTRLELRGELKKLQRLWQIPFVLVTHDLAEAQAIGDRLLFLEMGRQVSMPPPSHYRPVDN